MSKRITMIAVETHIVVTLSLSSRVSSRVEILWSATSFIDSFGYNNFLTRLKKLIIIKTLPKHCGVKRKVRRPNFLTGRRRTIFCLLCEARQVKRVDSKTFTLKIVQSLWLVDPGLHLHYSYQRLLSIQQTSLEGETPAKLACTVISIQHKGA